MLRINNLSKTYTDNNKQTEALRNISLSVEKGEFIALVGPSGSGKTTLLKILAGLIKPTSGQALLNDKSIDCPSRSRGMVFQQFSLFPWLTVRENIAFGLGLAKKKDEEKIDSLLDSFGLKEFENSYPKSLSGGMQQRVAIARTLVVEPEVILMDEPFGSLDAQTRSKMQDFLARVYEKTQTTIVFVTHDIEEAVFLANKVYVLSNRPTTIKSEHTISFGRPREHSLKHSKEFFDMSVQIAKELE